MTRYRLRATLVDSTPEIWRAFEIRGSERLRMLHLALQTMFGWRESHLHMFTDADPLARGSVGRRWESPDMPEADPAALSEEEFTVADVFDAGGPLWYEYDFGDGWIHRLDVVQTLPDDPALAPVVLLDGSRRGPFEDAGGVHGYEEKLAIAADPSHPEHREIVDWIRTTSGPWVPQDPEDFDLIGAQTELNLLFAPDVTGISRFDMSGLVKVDELRRPQDLTEASPLVALASTLPVPIRAELRQHLQRTGALSLEEMDPAEAARAIRPFGWLMEAVGAEGLTLTSAGWLPPATVLAGMIELGWINEWIGKGNREDLTPPIGNLRQAAQRLGLVRVQKGRLLLSVAARKALGDPLTQLRLIAGSLLRKLSDAEVDAGTLLLLAIADGTPREDRWRTVAFGLEMCGWRSSSGWRFTPTDIDHATFEVQQVLEVLGDTTWRGRRREDGPLLRQFAAVALR
ncbi:MAG: plasmid pRiA4b ORF-3 family protein [Actinobacteria bacterium]|nr:plasmid pRiA4b ORF-3 family protein [Actinomycetota bacterium]